MKNFLKCMVFVFVLIGCSEDEEQAPIEQIGEGTSSGLQISIAAERDCGATHPLVGQSMELRDSPTYGISGTVTIVSDCEIEFSNFSYNGTGPAVNIFGGFDGRFGSGIDLSEPIDGRAFNNATFSIFLPEGTTLDDINSFSVWCFRFNIDFSSASF